MASRRRHGVTQAINPVEVAQPVHSNFLSLPQSSYDNAWSLSGNFVHPDPLADTDSLMPPPPTTLSLPVPPNNYTANTLLYSPSSDGMSQSFNQLPSYGSSLMDGGNGDNDWKIDPSLYHSPSEPSPRLQFEKLEITPETEVKFKDLSGHQAATANMTPRQRAAHRKAIEEKSSMKRKLAEQRLSKAVTSRLGGTFVPGLANQMNQAADIIERDAQTIQALEAELSRLRKTADVQMKYRV